MRSSSSFSAAETIGLTGPAPVLILCEHASNTFPAAFGDLGTSPETRASHAAWDIGARDLALQLAGALEAPLVAGGVSRLIYDCNRPPEAADAVPEASELHDIPGNRNLSPDDRQARVDQVYQPFCRAVDHAITEAGPTALITVHSFTPSYFGKARSVEIGVLHDRDARLADVLLAEEWGNLKIERNQPYGPADGVTHSLRLHAESRGLLNVMLEVRNDLLAQSPERIAQLLAANLKNALSTCGVSLREAV